MNAARRALGAMTLLLAGASLGACASGAELALPTPPDDGIGSSANAGADEAPATAAGARFADQMLRARRDDVLGSIGSGGRHGEPRCTFARLAPVDGARRAFVLERCEHPVVGDDGPRLADRPVAALITHFVDDRLVRIDAVVAPRADGADTLDDTLAAVRNRLEERFGVGTASADGGRRWPLGDDVVELGEGDGGVRLSTLDGNVLALLPGLASVKQNL